MKTFKKGDIVRRITCSVSKMREGDIHVVSCDTVGDSVDLVDSGCGWVASYYELVKAAPAIFNYNLYAIR